MKKSELRNEIAKMLEMHKHNCCGSHDKANYIIQILEEVDILPPVQNPSLIEDTLNGGMKHGESLRVWDKEDSFDNYGNNQIIDPHPAILTAEMIQDIVDQGLDSKEYKETKMNKTIYPSLYLNHINLSKNVQNSENPSIFDFNFSFFQICQMDYIEYRAPSGKIIILKNRF